MSDPVEFSELIERLTRTGRLSQREAGHVVDEVLAFLDDTLEQFVRRRHRELQRENLNNDAIYRQLAQEVARRRFCAPSLSLRQVRRLIYG